MPKSFSGNIKEHNMKIAQFAVIAVVLSLQIFARCQELPIPARYEGMKIGKHQLIYIDHVY